MIGTMLSALAAMAASPSTMRMEQIDFGSGRRTQFDLSYEPTARTDGHVGSRAGSPLDLPESGPTPAYRGSRFSTIYRARDLFDLALYPARAVAKLYQLGADGKRAKAACTAQFVGPRHLVTAAHCIADPNSGKVHPGFELAFGFDGGKAGGIVPVERAWIEADKMRLARPEDALVTPERCSDLALIEVERPIGREIGWLGMRDLEPRADTRDAVLHRFAYPHVSSALGYDRLIESAPADQRAALEEERNNVRLSEPDFSPDNMYYEFGQADEAKGRYIAYNTPYSAPGRSGSALIDGDGRIVALASRGYLGTFYSCRLTAAEIGAIAALVRRAGER